MPTIKVDSTEPTQSIAPGIHLARIEHAVDAVSKNNNEMLQLEVRVGPLLLKSWVVFTEKNQDNVKQFGNAIGKQPSQNGTLTIEPSDCIGKIAKVKLVEGDKINPNTNRGYLEIKNWLPASAGASDDLMADALPF